VFLHDSIFNKFTGGIVHGPCHHGMAHPQVADVGMDFNVDDSSEYME